MTIFADASALVAIVADEPEAPSLERALASDAERLWSAMSEWEAVAALCRTYGLPVATARAQLDRFAQEMALRLILIGSREAELALDAYARYGKGRHKAALNMGDCFAYACAKANGARLLFKGEDFALTDVERA